MSALQDRIADIKTAFNASNDPNVVANQVAGAGTNTTFPHDLINQFTGRNYYIDIQFQEYQRRSIFDRAQLIATGGIQLPIPSNLKDQTSSNWSESNMATNAALGAGIESFLQGKDNNKTLGETATQAGVAAATGLAAGGINNLQQKYTGGAGFQLNGVAQNPFMTFMYQSPTFKAHQFEWTLSPRNQSETETLKNIIAQFKSNMLPDIKSGTGGSLLTYPNMAKVTIYPSGYLYDFKYCVVRDFTVNFAPSGPAFFNNSGAPVQVVLSVGLQEIEFFTRSDITGRGMSPAGGIPINQSNDIMPGHHV